MGKKCIGYNDITKMFVYQDEETGLIYQDKGVLGVDKIEEIKTTFGINGTGDMFTKSKRCECCKVEFLLRDIKGDLCVNCYDFIEERQNDKIADLEAKLAESEKQNKELYNEKESAERILRMSSDEQTREILELKQQLAEKDKTIKNLRIDIKDWEDLEEKISTKYDKVVEKFAQANQDKISFCIKKLEKVKEHLETEIGSVESFLDPIEYEDYHELLGVCRGYKNSIEEIDNQIEKLKEIK